MRYWIGTDEAGYGPKLGPLVIAASVWEVAVEQEEFDFYDHLATVVTSRPPAADDSRLWLADSKQLFTSGRGLAALEHGVLTLLASLGVGAARWRALWQYLAPDAVEALPSEAWHADYDPRLPVEADVEPITHAAARLADGMQSCGVRLVALACRVVFAGEFNCLVDTLGNKAHVLSRETLRLVAQQLDRLGDACPVHILCDKHGGRDRYSALLQDTLQADWIDIVQEGRQSSVYRWGPAASRREVHFEPRSERFLPAAVASMTAKYLRELAMRPFNEFWCARVPGLQPTAGYPVDAARFQRSIAATQLQLGIRDETLWRCR